MREKFEYPDDAHVGGMMMLASQEDMKRAIQNAAREMKETGFEPKFSRLANVILNADEETKEFTQKCTAHIPKGEAGEGRFNMGVFATSVLTIHRNGWDGYLTALSARQKEKDGWPAPAISLL